MSEDTLGPELESRLRSELDRIQPPHSSPRYLAARTRPINLRLAPALLAASVISILALSAFVATGSANPVVWGERVVTVLQPSTASPSAGQDDHRGGPASTPSQSPARTSPLPTERAEPTETPQANESPEPEQSAEPAQSPKPEPSDGHSGSGSDPTSDSGEIERS